MRRALCWMIPVVFAFSCAPGEPEIAVGLEPTVECFETLTRHLSSDEMEGRGVGTEGLGRAARFIAGQFERLDLDDPFDGYLQPFEGTVGVEIGDGNSFSWNDEVLEMQEEFVPLGFSSSGPFDGAVVFAGYGISAEEIDYDDYAGLDVEGKVVLAMRYEPGEDDEDSPFAGRKASRWSDLRYKAMLAREAGAAALILVDPPSGEDDADRLPRLKTLGPISRAGIPAAQITVDVARRWFDAAGRDFESVWKEIDGDYRPRSFAMDAVRVHGTIDVVPKTARLNNVLGVLPGKGALADEVVAVGAHYDHLGYGGPGSLRPESTDVHNGADDNASGVAAMICGLGGLVAAYETAGDTPRRTVVGIAFTAEEMGLGGSGWYVRNPVFPIEDTMAMVNLDMVGRVRDNKLNAIGTDSSPEWGEVVEPAADLVGLEMPMGGDGYGPSDHMSFFEQEVPVLYLFTGAHEEYHTPDDDADFLNFEGGARVARVLQEIVATLASRGSRMAYQPSTGEPGMFGDSRGFGAYLGTIPDYSMMMDGDAEPGVLLSGVKGGGPADVAGVRAGDRIIEIAGLDIQNLYDMTYALRDNRPGEIVTVVVVRDGQELSLAAVLGDRSKMKPIDGESPHPNE